MLTTQLVPQAYVESRAVRETEKAKILGLRMTTPVAAQQTVMWTDLAIAADDKRDLSALVAPGMRAVAVRAANDDKSFALIRPGDRVDVVATMSAKEGSSSERQAIVLLQSVLVLAVGIDTSQEISSQKGSTESRDLLLHLSLNLPEAQMVALAAEKGRISVALRNPDDVKALEGIADLSSTTLTDRGSRKVVQDFRVNQGRPIKLPSGAPQ
jgi:pilus assembly protein CpaB